MNTLLKWLKRGFWGFVILATVLAAAGMIYQTAGAEADRRAFPPSGRLVDVGGFKMHLNCTGQGSPTVILEALSGGFSAYWGWVQSELGKATRVCSYDRAGRGWSEADPEPQSLARTVRNLHSLLANAGEAGPYVLVGHSIGGVYVRRFANDYPDEVAGIVLMDTAHPKLFAVALAQTDTLLRFYRLFPLLDRLGVGRVYFALGGEMDFGLLAEPYKAQLKSAWSSPEYMNSVQAEMRAARGIYGDAAQLKSLGSLPLVVISADQGTLDGWGALQEDLAHLSTHSIHRTVAGATHVSLIFNPAHAHQVVTSIQQLLETVRIGKPLAQ